jgi:protein TonB
MKNSVNLNSAEWCDMVFEKKNKKYGAYALRQTSGKRHIWAFGVVVVFVAIISFLPTLIDTVKATMPVRGPGIDTEVEIAVIDTEKDKIVEPPIERELTPPPVPVRAAIQHVPPIIAPDDEITDDNQPPTNDEVLTFDGIVSSVNSEGDSRFGVDPGEIETNNQIVEEPPVVDKPFVTVEQMPQFPGGEQEMQRFIANTLKYPVVAQENGIEGRVTIRFVVTAEGKISDVQVLRGIDQSCDREAVRVIKEMPTWIPGKQNGRNVPVYFTLPVVYKLRR